MRESRRQEKGENNRNIDSVKRREERGPEKRMKRKGGKTSRK